MLVIVTKENTYSRLTWLYRCFFRQLWDERVITLRYHELLLLLNLTTELLHYQ